MIVTVISVERHRYLDALTLSCGHTSMIGHDEPNAALVGAETSCKLSHKITIRALADSVEVEVGTTFIGRFAPAEAHAALLVGSEYDDVANVTVDGLSAFVARLRRAPRLDV